MERIAAKQEQRIQKQSGSITVEATLVLPVYILAILFIINFLNISYLQLTIQQGLNNAGRTLSQYCYAVDLTLGIEKINQEAEKIDGKVKEVEGVVTNFKEITGTAASIFQEFSLDRLKELVSQGKAFLKSVKSMKSSLAQIKGGDIVDYLLTTGSELGTSMLVEAMVDEYLNEMKVNRSMLNGKIQYQVCLSPKGDDLVLIATYQYQSGMFSMFTDGIDMRQVVVLHPWVGGKTKGVRQK